MGKFVKGDKVRCTSTDNWAPLKVGKEYTVADVFYTFDREYIRLQELRAMYPGHSRYASSFERAVADVPAVVVAAVGAEADPKGIPANAPGAKLDAGKVMAGQVLLQFPRALLGVAEVGSFGARKYSMGGWQHVENGFARYEDAEFRHILKRAAGETFDSDSKLHHLKHEAWNALAKLELFLRDEAK